MLNVLNMIIDLFVFVYVFVLRVSLKEQALCGTPVALLPE